MTNDWLTDNSLRLSMIPTSSKGRDRIFQYISQIKHKLRTELRMFVKLKYIQEKSIKFRTGHFTGSLKSVLSEKPRNKDIVRHKVKGLSSKRYVL